MMLECTLASVYHVELFEKVWDGAELNEMEYNKYDASNVELSLISIDETY